MNFFRFRSSAIHLRFVFFVIILQDNVVAPSYVGDILPDACNILLSVFQRILVKSFLTGHSTKFCDAISLFY